MLKVSDTTGESAEIVDTLRNGGTHDRPSPLIVARTYDPQTTALLLAAPDMLEVLRDTLATLEAWGDGEGETAESIRDVIAKAAVRP